ncbi:hypothetical protein [Pseudomonas viridiflava]|uniref:hypothetical protein n=1 Tax=Pseudomonas viridiflava TaxID=33069 RepID=UPI000F03DC75|nr:hypothetical protein [Pseudomonas viridiflava]
MKKFRFVNVDAGELVRGLGRMGDLRAKARAINIADFGRPLSMNDVRVIWEESSGPNADLPSILVASEDVLGNLLPRMLALPSAVVPVTSFMNTWAIEDFAEREVFDKKPLSNVAALGFVGLIIGELLTVTGSNADLRLMGMDGVRRTLSFVCAQAVLRGGYGASLVTIVDRWLEASALTANEVNHSALAQILYLCEFLQNLSARGNFDGAASENLAHQIQLWIERYDDPNARDLLQRSLPQVVLELRGISSREKRYDLVMEELQRSAFGKSVNPLKQGFLISLIDPGSFEFLELAKQASPDGSVATAYFVCAVILGKESALRNFNGFGWTVFNHGLQFNTEMPMDISIVELRILHDGRRSSPIPFRTRSPWLIDVELAPMVIGSFGNLAKRKASSHRAQEASDAVEREEVIRNNLMTAMRALEDAYGVIQGRRPRQDIKQSKPPGQRK